MSETNESCVWRCSVCGYLHEGEAAPDECPICGAKSGEFESCEEIRKVESTAIPLARAKAWRCLVCEYLHEDEQPPAECPVCGAPAHQFEAVAAPQDESSKAVAAAGSRRLLVIGGGVAGLAAAEAFEQTVDQAEVTIVSEEPGLPYYRLNLTRYLAGEVKAEALPVHPEEWYREHPITLLDNCSVRKIDPEKGQVELTNGKTVEYDRLLLCTGSHPYLPPLPGIQLPGVKPLRTVEDARFILERALQGVPCVIVGGGVLGIEVAGALALQGADVTLLESHEWLMPRQLNRAAAARLRQRIEAIGVDLRQNARTRELTGDGQGVRQVVLQSGEHLPAELVVVATGVRPNTALARKAGLEVETGIVVDNHLRTSQPNIFAAGDAAEHNGTLYGLWNVSQFQGRIAGLNAAGDDIAFGGMPRSNSLKVLGVELASIGKIEAEDGSYQTVGRETDDAFCHFVFHDGHMVGAILMDAAAEFAAEAKKAIEGRQSFDLLLRHDPQVEDVLQAIGELAQPAAP